MLNEVRGEFNYLLIKTMKYYKKTNFVETSYRQLKKIMPKYFFHKPETF